MKEKFSLGKGLASLIPDIPEQTIHGQNSLLKLSIQSIRPAKNQPRKHFDEALIIKLSKSLKNKGMIQPVVVRKMGSQYEIIAGERRWRAAKHAGFSEIPVIVKTTNDKDAYEQSLIENIQRENLNPIEEAHGYHKLLHDYNLTHDQIAEQLGKNRTSITNTLRLLKLPNDIQELVIHGKISEGHARAILALETKPMQDKLALLICEKNLSVREAEEFVKNQLETKSSKKSRPIKNRFISQQVLALEEKLKQTLETKITIHAKKNKGEIIIHYVGNDELERIIEKILTTK